MKIIIYALCVSYGVTSGIVTVLVAVASFFLYSGKRFVKALLLSPVVGIAWPLLVVSAIRMACDEECEVDG